MRFDVTNVAPTVTVTGPASVGSGAPIGLVVAPADAGAADTFSYEWRVRLNGVLVATGDAVTLEHLPAIDGVYHVDLTVVDDDGGRSALISHTVVVGNQILDVQIGGATETMDEGSLLRLSGSTTSVTAGYLSEYR